MREQDWAACPGLDEMLSFLEGKATDRQFRLLACACARSVWPLLDTRDHALVEATERFADGGRVEADWRAWQRSPSKLTSLMLDRALAAARATSWDAAWAAAGAAVDEAKAAAKALGLRPRKNSTAAQTARHKALTAIRAAHVELLRDIVGNPSTLLAVEPAWRTPDVLALATSAYEERSLPSGHLDNARLAVLADALEDAGASGPLPEHLRSPGPHVRGCHALDALLGRK
jgi:hypothetical protein